MYLYFVRHGESEANILKVFSNRGVKHGLTEKGREQVRVLAEKLKGLSFEAVFTSPLLRAVQTTEILAEKLGVSYKVAHELAEFDVGILEDHHDDQSWNRYFDLLREWMEGHHNARVEGGESLNDIKNRILPFIQGLKNTYSSEANILLIGHGGTYRCIFPFLFNNIDASYIMANHLVNADIVLAKSVEEKYRCIRWGDQVL